MLGNDIRDGNLVGSTGLMVRSCEFEGDMDTDFTNPEKERTVLAIKFPSHRTIENASHSSRTMRTLYTLK